MRRILVVSANRAERGLLEPIMKELQKRKDVEASWCLLTPMFPEGQNILSQFSFTLAEFKPDIVVVPCDRWEAVYVAAHALHQNYIVAHFHAGNIRSNHPDEMNRRAISCFSHIMFCETTDDLYNLVRAGEEQWRIHVVGSTAFDHVEIDESLCPTVPYDLVLLHPDPLSSEATWKDLKTILHQFTGKKANHIVWLAPNRDRNYEIILDNLKQNESRNMPWTIYFENLPRSKFLGLLKNCKRAIGNSSSFVYELPFINPKAELIKVGKRNLERASPSTLQKGGSAKIAEILATIPLTDVLRRKKLCL